MDGMVGRDRSYTPAENRADNVRPGERSFDVAPANLRQPNARVFPIFRAWRHLDILIGPMKPYLSTDAPLKLSLPASAPP
jgi:hypothetical protein